MKNGPRDEEAAEAPKPRHPGWWARWRSLPPESRDNVIMLWAGALCAVLLVVPLYNVITDSGSRPGNFTFLGGLIGLVLAAYAVMSNRVASAMRLPLGLLGVVLIAICWGFGDF